MSNVEEVLESLTLKEGEMLVLVTDQKVSHTTVDAVPEPLQGRVLFVSGATAYAVVEDAVEELADKCRKAPAPTPYPRIEPAPGHEMALYSAAGKGPRARWECECGWVSPYIHRAEDRVRAREKHIGEVT